MNVKWYRDSTLLEEQNYNVDNADYFCNTQVQAYNKIVITIGNMQKANRFLKIFNISDGITRQFYNDELENVQIIEEITNNNKALNINQSDLVVLPNNTTGVLFQRTLPFSIYRNDVLYGRFFVDSSTSNSDKSLYKLKVSDYIKTLDGQSYLGGIYSNVTVATLIADILGDIPYSLDASLGAYTISGYLPILTKREALRQVAFCTNAFVDTSRSDKIIITPLSTSSSATINKSDILSLAITQENIVTKIELNTELLTTRNASTDEIYNATLNGTTSILFDSPKFNLTISGGTIVSSNCNYAIISGTGGTVVLSGQTYEQYINVTNKTNSYTVSTDIEKIDSYSTTLTCNNINLLNLLTFVEFKIKSKFMMGSIKVGDIISLDGTTARVLSLSYDISQTNIYAEAELEAYYE